MHLYQHSYPNLYRLIYKTVPALFIIFMIYTAVMPAPALALGANDNEKRTSAQDDFQKQFREARDLMDSEEWAKAAQKFSEVIEKYPGNKSIDQSLYWLAYCNRKQNKYKEMEAALDRLFSNYPTSTWVDDAKVMRMRFEAPMMVQTIQGQATISADNARVLNLTRRAEAERIYQKSADIYTKQSDELAKFLTLADTKVPLEREDEIKLAAFQSLFSADPARAIDTLGQMFRSGSKASENLKIEMLRVLRRPRGFTTFGSYSSYNGTLFGNLSETRAESPAAQTAKADTPRAAAPPRAETARADSAKINQMIRDTLVKIYPQETSTKIRKEIIYILSGLDQGSLDYVVQLYASETDKEIKKTILNSFFNSSSFYNWSGPGVTTVAGVATVSGTATLTPAPSLATGGQPKIELSRLIDIIRAEKDPELKNLAISNLGRFHGWTTNAQFLPLLADMYDGETDENVKSSIIETLANSGQSGATKKLLDIARNEKSDKLRLEAIRQLGRSKDPEALKYLEDLIK